MNNEIKEIINDLRKTADNSLFIVCSSQEELDKIPKYTANFLSVNDRQAKILLDYITNLQEENERLKELCNKYEEEHKTTFKIWKKDLKNFEHEKNRELKSRIDKAREFIEEELTFYITIGGTNERKLIGYNKAFDELLKILQGENNE